MKKLIRNEAARWQSASLWKKILHTSSYMYFALISSAHITITSSEEALKVCKHSFFLEIKVKGSVTCN